MNLLKNFDENHQSEKGIEKTKDYLSLPTDGPVVILTVDIPRILTEAPPAEFVSTH